MVAESPILVTQDDYVPPERGFFFWIIFGTHLAVVFR